MIRVICIDGKSNNPQVDNLPEFVTLEVNQSPIFNDCYIVVGYEKSRTNRNCHWNKRRFMQLSDDEVIFVNNKEEVYA